MPSRGSYQVANGEDPTPPSAKTGTQRTFVDPEKCPPPSRADTSFRDCVLSLALVLLIIAILVLAVHPWDRHSRDSDRHGAAAVHGNKTKLTSTSTSTTTTTSTTAKSTTVLVIERHGEQPTDPVDYDTSNELSSSSTSTSASATEAQKPITVVYVSEDQNNQNPTTRQLETTTTTIPIVYPTVHGAATVTSTEAQPVTEDEQYLRKPLFKPIADETDPATTTQRASKLDVVTDQSQAAGDQTDDGSVQGTDAPETDTTNVDFEMAVANNGPTTPSGDESARTTFIDRQARFLEGKEETTRSQIVEQPTTTPDGEIITSPTVKVTTSTPGAEITTPILGIEGITTNPIVENTTPKRDVEEVTTTPNQRANLKADDPKKNVCTSPKCRKQAARMLGLMNHAVPECSDFYQYACGGLRDNALLGEEDAKADAMARIEKELAKVNDTSSSAQLKFRRYFEMCVENVGDKDKRIAKLSTSGKDAVESIDKLYTKSTWSDQWSLTDLLTRLMLQHSTPLLDVMLDVSSDSPSKFAFKLTPPVTPSLLRVGPERPACFEVAPDENDLNTVYAQYLNCKSNHSLYLQEVASAVVALRLFPQVNSTQRDYLVEEIRQTIEMDVWDSELLETMPKEGEKRRQLLAKEFHKMTVRELQEKYKMVNWRQLLSGLLRISSSELPDSAEVQVYFQPYFDKLFSSLEFKDMRMLHNTLLAMYARDLYTNALNGGPRYLRKDHCLTVAATLMEDVASALYLSNFDSRDLDTMESESKEIFTRLRETLELQLQDAKWLDSGSRSDVVAKLHKMRIDVSGGRDLFTDDVAIDSRMAEINLHVSNDLIKLSTALTARYRRLMYSMYNEDPNSIEAGWTHFLLPYSTTATSIYGLNSVMVPFGLLTWPLYDLAVPKHVRLARLGFVIAHEMAHHYDSIGINYRAGGGRKESLLITDATTNTFKKYVNSQCTTRSRYVFGTSHTEPDNSTYQLRLDEEHPALNERLADDTANALSLDTGLRWEDSTGGDSVLPYLDFTPNQEHFLAVAQMFCTKSGVDAWRVGIFENEHPPAHHRVNDMFKNSVVFANSFNCTVDKDYMSPSDPCEVFPALSGKLSVGLTSDVDSSDYSGPPTQ